MQQSSHIGNARRDERVPLSALIELRSEYGDESLAADGLDVSASGLAVRAAFVPEVGTRLFCDFRCPPQDDAVHAVGEVVWATWDGPRSGSFGMRFLELDTKSATTIRRYVEPGALAQEPAAPEPPRVANMRIDGVPTPIEADVRLLEKDCIVLEQELSFLRLGRGIEVDVPGRGKERGRIASIELRQGPLDTPTLVFGVLLDEKPALSPARVAAPSTHAAARLADALEEPFSDLLPRPEQDPATPTSAGAEALPSIIVEPEVSAAARSGAPALEAATPVAQVRAEAPRKAREEPQVVRVAANASDEARPSEDDEVERLLQNRTPEFVVLLKKLLVAFMAWTRTSLAPAFRSLFDAPKARVGEAPLANPDATAGAAADVAKEAPAEPATVVPFSQRVLLPLARARSAGVAFMARLKKRPAKRRTTSPTPRIQRSQPVRTQRADAPANPPRNRRLLTMSLALVGVGLGVYALAPRSGADRIRVRTREAEPSVSQPALPVAMQIESTSAQASSAPTVQPLSPLPAAASASSAPVAASAAVDDAPTPSLTTARFGEANVPNGRTFVLRMSGPVTSLEGEKRDDGFSVRVPGRLALDRASPIATSHRAVARALILNRGEYAELTVEFLPGMRPKYQVSGKDNTLEVTLERL